MLFKRSFNTWKQLPLAVKAVIVVILALPAYLPFVVAREHDAEARRAELREEAPEQYLGFVRSHEGMHAYVSAFARVRHYEKWRDTAPTFLIGSWTLLSREKDGIDGDPGAHCLQGLVIEDGRVRRFGNSTDRNKAQYRIEDERVLARLDGRNVMRIDVPDYPRNRHEIEVTLPGESDPLLGFRCH